MHVVFLFIYKGTKKIKKFEGILAFMSVLLFLTD